MLGPHVVGSYAYGSLGAEHVIESDQRDIFVTAINRAKDRAQAGRRLGVAELLVIVQPGREVGEVPELPVLPILAIDEGARTDHICTAPPMCLVRLLRQTILQSHNEVRVDHGPKT